MATKKCTPWKKTRRHSHTALAHDVYTRTCGASKAAITADGQVWSLTVRDRVGYVRQVVSTLRAAKNQATMLMRRGPREPFWTW
jgi:hypothetical protein